MHDYLLHLTEVVRVVLTAFVGVVGGVVVASGDVGYAIIKKS